MTILARREFLAGVAAAPLAASAARKDKMRIHLVCGALGVMADQRQAIEYAQRFGFDAAEPNAQFLASLSDEENKKLLDELKAKNLVFGNAGLSVDFRGDETKFRGGMDNLPRLAKALERAGVTRVGTWLSPASDTLTYMQNFEMHRKRLGEIGAVLGDHGQRLALEYVGPKTSWTARRYPFLHTMAETKDLIAATGRNNIGFLLDSWHWYCAGETEADLLSIKAEQVVSVDLNDAPAGIPVDQQKDSVRELPAATGVIDVKAFLNALVKLGYDGPVRSEPFNAELRKLPPEQALQRTIDAMKKAFSLIS